MNVRPQPEPAGTPAAKTRKPRGMTAPPPPPAPRSQHSCVAHYKELDSGAMEVHLLIEERAKVEYHFSDNLGAIFPAHILTERDVDPDTINLVEVNDCQALWRITESIYTYRTGVADASDWTLSNHPSHFIASMADPDIPGDALIAEATLLDPLTSELPRLTPGVAYRSTLLLAIHRCTATIVITILDLNGVTIWSEEQPADPRARGGPTEEHFQKVSFDFIAPIDAAFLKLSVQKGATYKREGFVFFCRPTLQAHVTPLSSPPVRAPTEALKVFRSVDVPRLRIVLLAPPDVAPLGSITSLQISVDGHLTRLPCTLRKLVQIEIAKVTLDHRLVRVVGRTLSGADDAQATLGVFVNGTLETVEVRVAWGVPFDVTLPLSDRCLDGTVKCLEIRQTPAQAVLWTGYEFVPTVITPWAALQQYAGAPLDHRLSPAESFRLKSFKGWAARQAMKQIDAADIPDLASLHEELVSGFRKRKTYPKLNFPATESPVVSIVVPVHNKFEVTYFCLCSILFASNFASFEVIVVDDGSSDQTLDIRDFVSGVTVVRHASAQGFVVSCNDGAACAKGEYICFLNNDTEVTAGWLDELLDVFASFDDVGLAGSRLLYPDGSLQEAGGIVWGTGNPWNVGRNQNASHPQFNYLRQVDYLSGAAILLPHAVWDEVGGFSPEFAPGYFEDTDLAMKVRETGRRIIYAPFSVVYHYEGQSSGTSTASGMKRFQEINRPKFRQKWRHLYGSHGPEGHLPEREKDRGVSFRVLFIDHRYPTVDMDAGSYAAFQEVRMLQALGGKVTYLPRNLAWMDRHTKSLQRIGVECLYAPFVIDFAAYVRDHSSKYDILYVNRYSLAEHVIENLPKVNRPKVIFNLADLHFLREMRESLCGTPGYTMEGAEATRAAELAVVRASDLTLSYSEVELAVLQSHSVPPSKLARVPWVVEAMQSGVRSFEGTKDVLFLGGFQHPPNAQGVAFFVREVGPLLRRRLPEIHFHIVGSAPTADVLALESEWVTVHGYVDDISEMFNRTRIFVAPLLSGAGIKGKVLEGLSRGAVMVLSPLAAEGVGVTDGTNCRIAAGAESWATSVSDLYRNRDEWLRLSAGATSLAAGKYNFESATEQMREALARVDVFGAAGLRYRHSRPSYR